MANRIKVATENAILALWRRGWSFRRIARELGVHRDTVSRHVRVAEGESKPAISTAGADAAEGPKPAIPTAGRKSLCEPYREIIVSKLDQGLSAQRIFQDLACDHGFEASYESVKRYVRRLGKKTRLPFRRIETDPGQEAQVDFGKGAPVTMPGGRRKRPHAFRIMLSCSRKGYTETVWRQTTEEFIRALENAFWHFGGVPRTLVIDNLKAAVTRADWFDPDIHPKIEAFARHYGTVILPTKPRTPRHKGKIEAGVKYVQSNALKGRVFESLEDENAFLAEWEDTIADLRIHGTTRKQVKKLFEEERPSLVELPVDRFPFFHEGERTVHRDGHVELEKAYYSAPPEYVGRRVWVRWDARLVRIFNHKFEEIALHPKVEPGRFKTNPSHVPAEKTSIIERGAEHLLKRAALIGNHAQRWADAVVKSRGIRGMRTVQGLLSLARKHTSMKIDRACKEALARGVYRLKSVRALVNSNEEQAEFEFMADHPIIRNMNDYGRIVRVDFHDGGCDADIVPISAAPHARPARGETDAGGGSSLSGEGGLL
jgi:transposase